MSESYALANARGDSQEAENVYRDVASGSPTSSSVGGGHASATAEDDLGERSESFTGVLVVPKGKVCISVHDETVVDAGARGGRRPAEPCAPVFSDHSFQCTFKVS